MVLGLGFGPRCCVNQGSGLTAVTRVHSSLAVGMQIRSGRGGNPVARAGDHVPGLGHGHPFGYRDATAFRSCQSNTATSALPTPAAAASFWFRHSLGAPRPGGPLQWLTGPAGTTGPLKNTPWEKLQVLRFSSRWGLRLPGGKSSLALALWHKGTGTSVESVWTGAAAARESQPARISESDLAHNMA